MYSFTKRSCFKLGKLYALNSGPKAEKKKKNHPTCVSFLRTNTSFLEALPPTFLCIKLTKILSQAHSFIVLVQILQEADAEIGLNLLEIFRGNICEKKWEGS